MRRWFRSATASIAASIPVIMLALFLFLTIYAWPAVRFNGLHFLYQDTWNLGRLYSDPISVGGQQVLPDADYGILFLIVGTLLSSLMAMALALPVGIGTALFLAEGAPRRLRGTLSFFVELLAGVPSVVFGLWGYVVLIPLLSRHVYPMMARFLGFIPFFGGPTGSGYGLLTAALVLALMIVPLIAATLRDAIVATPIALREAGFSVGATSIEVFWKVVLPSLRRVLIGSSMLALGRALGETMAVLMVSGNALNYLPDNAYSPISTMSSFIVSQLDSALQDPTSMAVRALAEIALILLVISAGVNMLARVLLRYAGGR
ncbi:MAG: phosphate ABC transporter permease subunit PstC [Gammaproteobacteria bacterium]|nr:phosphate ABC transporter permease subunit PstC [Gammaproteobacteria bacterium]